MDDIIQSLIDQEEQLFEQPDGTFGFNLPLDLSSFNEESILDDTNLLKFNINLSEMLEDNSKKQLGESIVLLIKDDRDSLESIFESYKKMKKYLGLSLEDTQSVPFKNSSGIYDTTMSNAVFSFCSQFISELLPQNGPCEVQVLGIPTPEKLDAAERLKTFFNQYLTYKDVGFRADFIRMAPHVALYGSCFRKVCYDSFLKMPVSRMIEPEGLFVHNDFSSLEEAPRITHSFCLTEKEFLTRIESGVYSYYLLEEASQEKEKNKESYHVYECHIDLSLTDFFPEKKRVGENPDIPRPYIVTLLHDGSILSIRRNYYPGDPLYKRINYFIHYSFLPSFGLHGYGLGHLMGSSSIFLTNTKRHVLNSEAMKIYPRGIKTQGIDPKNKSSVLQGPGEFIEIDTKGKPIQEVFTFLESPPQSSLLIDLLREIRAEMLDLSSICNVAVPEGSLNAPVGTTLALLEKQSKVTSSILQGMHASLTKELSLIYNLLRDGIQNPFNFEIPGQVIEIEPKDFSLEMQLIPSSDGGVSSFAHNVIKSEALLRIAQMAPELHDMRAVFYNVYKAMKVQNIEELLPPKQEPKGPPPIDPNEVLLLDIKNKFEIELMKHEKEMLSLAIQKTKILQDYAINYQKMVLESQKAGLQPQDPVNIPIPDIPLPEQMPL